MLGCSSWASTWRSPRNRRAVSAVSRPQGSSLTATSFSVLLVGAARQIDDAHAAATEDAVQAIGSDPAAEPRRDRLVQLGLNGGSGSGKPDRQGTVEQVGGWRIDGGQQRRRLGRDGRVRDPRSRDGRRPLGARATPGRGRSTPQFATSRCSVYRSCAPRRPAPPSCSRPPWRPRRSWPSSGGRCPRRTGPSASTAWPSCPRRRCPSPCRRRPTRRARRCPSR